MKRIAIAAILFSASLTACGGGSSSSPTPPSPTSKPSTAPSSSPTTAPASKYKLGAIDSGDAGQSPDVFKRAMSTAARPSLASIVDSVPTAAIQSYSTNPNWGSIFGNLYLWAYNPSTSETVPETSLTVAIAPAGLTTQVITPDTNAYDGLTNDWVVGFFSPTARGQYTATATFADGTTGTVPINVYDDVYVGCPGETPPFPAGNIFTNNVDLPTSGPAFDVTIDCTGNNVVFPNGAVLASNPIPNIAGDTGGTIASVTTVPAGIPSTSTSFPISSVATGQVYIARTVDGGYAKYEPLIFNDYPGEADEFFGLALHATGTTFTY